MSKLYTIDQMNELANALENQGYSPELVKKLGSGNMLTQLFPVVKGFAEVKQITHIINCDADPFIPKKWKVEEHKKGGQIKWDPEKITLYHLSLNQLNEKYIVGDKQIRGNQFRRELENKPVLNANVLDYLLANPSLIPEEWKGKGVVFWGTIYRESNYLYVRELFYKKDDGWNWGSCMLDVNWYVGIPVAILAN